MIYLDSSVALAEVLSEEKRPPTRLWDEDLVSSRLLAYEVCNRLHVKKATPAYRSVAFTMLDKVTLIDLSPEVLERALDPFPKSVRTLDALHLATIDFLMNGGQTVALASYDARLIEAASALSIPAYEL